MHFASRHVRSYLSVSNTSLCGEECLFETTCQIATMCGNTVWRKKYSSDKSPTRICQEVNVGTTRLID